MDESGSTRVHETIQRLVAPLSSRPPNPLYHYTSPLGLHGIVESRGIWATNIHYLNDETEFRLAFQLSLAELARADDRTTDSAELLALERMREISSGPNYQQVFVASFSEDADLLSQWRAYCPDGGFSIGFDGEALARAGGSTFSLFPCIYEPEAQSQTIRQVIELCVDEFRTRAPFETDRELDQSVQQAGNEFLLAMNIVAPLLKHPTFKEELEWRLICGRHQVSEVQVEFRPGPTMLVPFVSCALSDDDSVVPVDHLVVGPTPHLEIALLSARSFLEAHKIVANCVISEVPYRGW